MRLAESPRHFHNSIFVSFLTNAATKQPQAKAGGFELRTGSPDTRRLNCNNRDIIRQLPDLIEVTVSSDSAIQRGDFIVPRLLSVTQVCIGARPQHILP